MKTRILAALGAAALASAAAHPAAAEPTAIRITYASTAQMVPLLPLAPKELYRHYGKSYTIEPTFIAGAGPALTAVASGNVELAALGPQSMANAIVTAKLDLRAIVQVLTTDYPGYTGGQFWCRAPIAKAEDMRGKTVAVNARATSPEAALRAYLGGFGMTANDYQVVEMPFPAILPALMTKKVDCGVLVSPWQFAMENRTDFHQVFKLADVLGPTETAVWAGKPEWIAKNRAALVDFVEDHLRFRKWAHDPKTQPEAAKLAAQFDKRPPAMLTWIFTNRDNYHHPEGAIDVARFQKNVDDLHRLGVTPGTIDAKKYIDLSIQQEAAARLRAGG